MFELQLRRDEEQEEQLVNSAIQAEIAYNFPTYASWAHREGTMSAKHRLAKFEDKLRATGAELRELRKKRTELRLNTRDMVEHLKSHCRLESLTEQMANLKVQPCPRAEAPHQKLGSQVDALLVARKKVKRSAVDLLSSMR